MCNIFPYYENFSLQNNFQSNWVCSFHLILLRIMLPIDDFYSRSLYLTTAVVECCVAAVIWTSLQCCNIFLVLRDHWFCTALLGVENWVRLRPLQAGVRDVAFFIILPVQTQSNLVCSFRVILLTVINTYEGHIFSRFIFYQILINNSQRRLLIFFY
jgi:hypothetical protein